MPNVAALRWLYLVLAFFVIKILHVFAHYGFSYMGSHLAGSDVARANASCNSLWGVSQPR